MAEPSTFTIASRKSPLAQIQARHVRGLLGAAAGIADEDLGGRFPVKPFVSTGDRHLTGSLADIGGKGLFTKEVEEALLAGEARFAVHSMKDMPAKPPEGLEIVGCPPREDPRDAFISPSASSPEDLPQSATLGAASVRRVAQTLARRPDLKIFPLRGNVQTRLERLDGGIADATYLAMAGLNRLGLSSLVTKAMAPEEMLPAIGQGALCIEIRADDDEARQLAGKIACHKTTICVETERAFLAELDGSCRTPIAGLAVIENDEVWFRGEVLSLDGEKCFTVERRFAYSADGVEDARKAGASAGMELKETAGAEFFEWLEKECAR